MRLMCAVVLQRLPCILFCLVRVVLRFCEVKCIKNLYCGLMIYSRFTFMLIMFLLIVDAWRVLVICGKLPRAPDVAATASEKGVYALFLFLLFKPYRSIEDLVESLLPADVTVGTVDDAWLQIYEGFLRWRRNLDEVASSCKVAACTHGSSSPPFDSVEWWSCMTSEKIRNYDVLQPAHTDEALQAPTNLTSLPEYVNVPADTSLGSEADNVQGKEGTDEGSESEDMSERGKEVDDSCVLSGDVGLRSSETRSSRRQDVVARHCGELLESQRVEEFHYPPAKVHARNAEGRYWKEFESQVSQVFPSLVGEQLESVSEVSWGISCDAALDAAERQSLFFKSVDGFDTGGAFDLPPCRSKTDSFDRALAASFRRLPEGFVRSPSVVMEAAFLFVAGRIAEHSRRGHGEREAGPGFLVARDMAPGAHESTLAWRVSFASRCW